MAWDATHLEQKMVVGVCLFVFTVVNDVGESEEGGESSSIIANSLTKKSYRVLDEF